MDEVLLHGRNSTARDSRHFRHSPLLVKRSAPGWFGGDAAPAAGDEALFCSSEICISVEFEQLLGVDAEAGEEMLRIAGVLSVPPNHWNGSASFTPSTLRIRCR
ncbi:MAG: hypothetical protein LC126_30000 [Bryobacterales bacterium]|nr:hypothetical protein [Bryobacterales bacterium]